MPNRRYENGAAFERRTKARLEQEGWTCFRTAGSHSPADLVCLRLGERPLMVQCKGGSQTFGPLKRAEFMEFATSCGAEAMLAERGLKFTLLKDET